MSTEQGHPIKVVARRTGLTPHVIRAWEKRYSAVSPMRTPTHRRLYSDEDLERLMLLRRATLAGWSIGQIAHLPTKRLRTLVTTDEAVTPPYLHSVRPRGNESSVQSHFDACLAEIEHLDAEALETALTRAAVALSRPVLIEQAIIPLMQKVGDLWRDGSLRVAHEHLASAMIRSFLGNLNSALTIPTAAPHLLVTTPAGQMHEFGALIVATTAASEGWRVTYLGPNLPAEEIAGAVQQLQAKAVALSIIYPTDDPHLGHELKKLRRFLGEEVVLIVGGRAADSYSAVLHAVGAVKIPDMLSLRPKLESLRTP